MLDKGAKVWQLNTKESAGKEKFRAAEFARSLVNERRGSEVTVFGKDSYHGSFCLLNFNNGFVQMKVGMAQVSS